MLRILENSFTTIGSASYHQRAVENTEHKFASPGIRTRCARLSGGIVAYGHNATATVFEVMDGGAQFLSAHERIVVLTQ